MALDHEGLIQTCYQLAEKAVAKGGQPYGALLAKAGEVLMRAENQLNVDGDSTRHVELILASRAMRELPLNVIPETILYVSTELCAMCAGQFTGPGFLLWCSGSRSKQSLC